MCTPHPVVRTTTNRDRPASGKVWIFYSTSQSPQNEEIRLITPKGWYLLVSPRHRYLRAWARLPTPFCYLTLGCLCEFEICVCSRLPLPPSIALSLLGTVLRQTVPQGHRVTTKDLCRYSRFQVRFTMPELIVFRSRCIQRTTTDICRET